MFSEAELPLLSFCVYVTTIINALSNIDMVSARIFSLLALDLSFIYNKQPIM